MNDQNNLVLLTDFPTLTSICAIYGLTAEDIVQLYSRFSCDRKTFELHMRVIIAVAMEKGFSAQDFMKDIDNLGAYKHYLGMRQIHFLIESYTPWIPKNKVLPDPTHPKMEYEGIYILVFKKATDPDIILERKGRILNFANGDIVLESQDLKQITIVKFRDVVQLYKTNKTI